MTTIRQRILYYCQSLVGIGHLTASLQIIEELSKHLDVDLIYGGIHYRNFPILPGLRVLELSPLLFNDSGRLVSPEHGLDCDIVWCKRREQIREFIATSYHGVVFEFYPFGRRKFKQEIKEIIDQVRARNGPVPLFSQIREILIPSDLADEKKIFEEVRNQFHSVLVRGDPAIISLDETFSLASQLGDQLFYGGYISPPPPSGQYRRQPQILVSQGGGAVGRNLLAAAIKVAPLLPCYQFLIATGSGATADDCAYLQALTTSNNVSIVPFLTNFREQLTMSALSINMGGDNTMLDMISTRTPSLAYPYPGNSEQALRIGKLAERGWISRLEEADLAPVRLMAKIQSTLNKPYPDSAINLLGATNISNKIRSVLAGSG